MNVDRQSVPAAVFAAHALALAIACVLAACEQVDVEPPALTRPSAPAASQATPGYFGEEYAEAHKALADRPAEEPAPTF